MIKVGEQARPLADREGHPARDLADAPVILEEMTARGPVMLVFLRGFS